jgi:hypothetical protein
MSEIKTEDVISSSCSLPSSVSQDVVAVNEEKKVAVKKRKRGRPKKEEVKKYIKRAKRGRPPGEAARIKELTASLLLTHSQAIIRKIVHKALNDDDKDQMAALKLCVDRMLPVSYFEDKGIAGGSRAITINITGVNDNPVEMIEHEPVEVETTLIDYEEEDDGSTS